MKPTYPTRTFSYWNRTSFAWWLNFALSAALLFAIAGCDLLGKIDKGGGGEGGGGEDGIVQAPALPGEGQPISSADRVYTADQSSNTVTVINPATGEVLGTIPVGEARLDGVLGPVDVNEVNAHGLGFSRDGQFVNTVSVTSNAVQVIDASRGEIVQTFYTARSPHEGFFHPDGDEVWAAVRGVDHVAVLDRATGTVTRQIEVAPGPSKVIFSPDGARAYVNHLRAQVLDVIDAGTYEIIGQVSIPEEAGGSSDMAVSPDGEEVWLGHPGTGKTTVVDAEALEVIAVLDSGPRTNHPNFVSTGGEDFAYVSIGDLNHTKVYRRPGGGEAPELVDTIAHTGVAPHGLWPSPDNSRVYVALQKSDAVDVIDTATREVIQTLRVGQDPQALVYVAGAVPEGEQEASLSQQGLGRRVENFEIETQGVEAEYALASVRDVGLVDELDVRVRGLPPEQTFTVWGTTPEGKARQLLSVRSNASGVVPEALAFVEFFDSYDGVVLTPEGEQP